MMMRYDMFMHAYLSRLASFVMSMATSLNTKQSKQKKQIMTIIPFTSDRLIRRVVFSFWSLCFICTERAAIRERLSHRNQECEN